MMNIEEIKADIAAHRRNGREKAAQELEVLLDSVNRGEVTLDDLFPEAPEPDAAAEAAFTATQVSQIVDAVREGFRQAVEEIRASVEDTVEDPAGSYLVGDDGTIEFDDESPEPTPPAVPDPEIGLPQETPEPEVSGVDAGTPEPQDPPEASPEPVPPTPDPEPTPEA